MLPQKLTCRAGNMSRNKAKSIDPADAGAALNESIL
jgi:hypothetical protein